jgi:hypothetical protein
VKTLAQVLEAHEYVPFDAFEWRCTCDWTANVECDYEADEHREHTADAVTAHLAALLADVETVEAVAEAIATTLGVGGSSVDFTPEARAAIAVIGARLGLA